MELFFIALRNVFRNPRRTGLNLVAVGLGVMVVLTMRAWIAGFGSSAYQTTIDLDTGDLQVLHQDYQDEARRVPLDLRLHDWPAVRDAVVPVPGVVAVGPRLDYAATLGNGETAVNVAVRGVDPASEARTNTLPALVTQGTWLTGGSQVVIGSGLARKLGLHVGDQVFLTALDQYGVRNLVDGSVAGVFTSGYGVFDDQVVFTPLARAQETLALGPGDATRLVVKIATPGDLSATVGAVTAALDARGLVQTQTLAVAPWTVFAKSLVDNIEARIRILGALMAILVVLVAVGILNSMSMAVQERFREIGTLRALGMNRRTLTRMFLWEGFALGLTGGLAGVAGALVLAWFGVTYGIDTQGLLPRDIPIPLASVLRPRYDAWGFPAAALGAALVAVVGSWFPARRAGRLGVRDALGSHI